VLPFAYAKGNFAQNDRRNWLEEKAGSSPVLQTGSE